MLRHVLSLLLKIRLKRRVPKSYESGGVFFQGPNLFVGSGKRERFLLRKMHDFVIPIFCVFLRIKVVPGARRI